MITFYTNPLKYIIIYIMWSWGPPAGVVWPNLIMSVIEIIN